MLIMYMITPIFQIIPEPVVFSLPVSFQHPPFPSITQYYPLHIFTQLLFILRTFFQSSLDKTNIEWISTRARNLVWGIKEEMPFRSRSHDPEEIVIFFIIESITHLSFSLITLESTFALYNIL